MGFVFFIHVLDAVFDRGLNGPHKTGWESSGVSRTMSRVPYYQHQRVPPSWGKWIYFARGNPKRLRRGGCCSCNTVSPFCWGAGGSCACWIPGTAQVRSCNLWRRQSRSERVNSTPAPSTTVLPYGRHPTQKSKGGTHWRLFRFL